MSARRDHDHPSPSRPQGRGDPGPHQRRLPRTRRPDDGDDADVGEPSHARRHVGVASEEEVGVVDVVVEQSQVRAGRTGLGSHRHRSKRRVLSQDRLFEGDQVGTGIESQLGGEHRARTMEGAQRVALLARLVLRQRQQRPPVLSQRLLGDARLCLGQHFPVTPGADRRVDAELLGVEAQLLQARRFGPARAPALQVDQRPAPPEGQRLTNDVGGALRLAQREQLARPPDQPLETTRVDVVSRHDQPVALRHRLDRARSEQLAQPHHAPLDHLVPRRRRSLPPKRVGQAFGADHLTQPQRQRAQHHPIARRGRSRDPVNAQRTQQRDTHQRSVRSAPVTRQWR